MIIDQKPIATEGVAFRECTIERTTGETNITLSLALDGTGDGVIATGIGFFDHMLELFTRHGMLDLKVGCEGDIGVDGHHTVEDIGICLGSAFANALGEGRGITRFADVTVPMDEALVLCAVDISGRGHLSFDVPLHGGGARDFEPELLEEFMEAFARHAGITIHLRLLAGKNTHHIIEACFKALARALRAAVAIDGRQGGAVPSTKGVLLL
jgi:imidazoleglycerol-phosphate dehydratase